MATTAAASGGAKGMSEDDAIEVLQQADDTQQTQQQQKLSWAELGAKGDRDSWKDLYRLLFTSLRSSSQHFKALTWETLALGWMGLSSAHVELRDDITGRTLTAADGPLIEELLYYARWAGAFTAGRSAEQVADTLGIQVAHIASYMPDSTTLLPASYLAVDTSKRCLSLVIRGTTSWPDVLNDLVAHTEQLPGGGGQVHSGMLACAQALIALQLPALRALLTEYPGYRIHAIGHSLGGGVAALIALLLRTNPSYRQQLSAAGGVVATGFGTPPVVTQELAEQCRSFVRGVVYNSDLVPRACVHTLARLRQELEEAKEGVYANNKLAGALRNSTVVASGGALVGRLFNTVTATKATQVAASMVSRNPATQRFVQAGLAVGATFLTGKLKQMHEEVVNQPAAPAAQNPAAAPAKPAAGQNTAAPAPTTAGGSNQQQQQQQQQGPGGDASAKVAALASGIGSSINSWWGAKSAGQQAGPAAAAPAPAAGAAGDQAAAAVAAVSLSGTPQGTTAAVAVATTASTMDDPADAVMLCSPGQLFYLKRSGVDAGASFELVSSDAGQSFKRILVHRSMLRDHYLTHYQAALQQLLVQLQQPTGQA